MDTSKLYETCTITRRSTTVSGWEETFSESTVYSSIPCYIRTSSANTIVGTTEQSNTQTVYITVDKIYTVFVWDIVTSGCTRYKVEQSKAFKLIENGNVRLKCVII